MTVINLVSCDRCGKRVEMGFTDGWPVLVSQLSAVEGLRLTPLRADLCPECYEQVRAFVKPNNKELKDEKRV